MYESCKHNAPEEKKKKDEKDASINILTIFQPNKKFGLASLVATKSRSKDPSDVNYLISVTLSLVRTNGQAVKSHTNQSMRSEYT